jgi:hypothetical protein
MAGIAISGVGVSAGDGVGDGEFAALAGSALPQALSQNISSPQVTMLKKNKLNFRMKSPPSSIVLELMRGIYDRTMKCSSTERNWRLWRAKHCERILVYKIFAHPLKSRNNSLEWIWHHEA